jgi:hypothetical protein
MLYRDLHGSNESFGFVAQDLSLPYSTAEPFTDYIAQDLDIWPLIMALPSKRDQGAHASSFDKTARPRRLTETHT